MGASEWSYFAPYQQDIAQALQQLREQVFASGDFYNRKAEEVEWLQTLDDDAYRENQQRSRKDYLLLGMELPEEEARIARIARLTQEQTTIEGLFLHDGGSGTHSILDIFEISEQFDSYTAAPLPQQELVAIFGTEQPTRKMLELHMKDVMLESPGRWMGAYIIVWKDEQPDEIFFFGFSGD